jgi:FG-GAP-like repeat/FG-GAP repeat
MCGEGGPERSRAPQRGRGRVHVPVPDVHYLAAAANLRNSTRRILCGEVLEVLACVRAMDAGSAGYRWLARAVLVVAFTGCGGRVTVSEANQRDDGGDAGTGIDLDAAPTGQPRPGLDEHHAIDGSAPASDSGPHHLDGGCNVGALTGAASTVGGHPVGTTVADLNHDGKLDVVVADTVSGTVSVLLGNGDGTLRPQVSYATGMAPSSVAVGDVNGDGAPDLAVANRGPSENVAVLLGHGDGTFGPAAGYAAGSYPAAVAMADLNGDRRIDLVVANDGSDGVGVLAGNGDGTFQTQVVSAPMILSPAVMALADFNDDGKTDLAVGGGPDDGVTVLPGNGDGTFGPGNSYFGYNAAGGLAAADLNGDGKVDLVLANPTADKVIAGLGAGDGTFSYMAAVGYAFDATPTSVAVGDVNGDGAPDLVIGTGVNADGSDSTHVEVMLGNWDGTFRSPVIVPAGNSPKSVSLGDMNGDGHLDVVAANYDAGTVSVIMLSPCGGMPAPPAPASACVNGAACTESATFMCGTPDIYACMLTCDCSASGLSCEEGCP